MWRIDNLIRKGEYLNWNEVVNRVNLELYGDEEEKHKGESAYRKAAKYARDFYEAGVFFEKNSYDVTLETIKLRDERTAIRKVLNSQARFSQKLDYLEEKMSAVSKINFPDLKHTVESSDNDIIAVISDLHIGECFDNTFGKYDTNIAEQRMIRYANEIISIAELHHTENCYLSIQGDLISSSIHKSIAITNRENVIDQLKIATELIASFCYSLAPHFKNIYIYNVAGNHSRIDKKDDAIHDERLDSLVSWMLKFILKEVSNITVMENDIDSGISHFNIRGKEYVAVHGDMDSFTSKGASDLITFLKYIPYAILSAHKHTCALEEFRGIKMIRSGSMNGSGNQNTIEKRLIGEPSQMVCVCTAAGIKACYPINLN